ncbi:MAG: SMP-30/gluconolactonase/LRE family protein [Janthinobacterium lividum]
MRIIAENLGFPEGPIVMADCSVLCVEIADQTLARVDAAGNKTVVARTGGGPNGAAIGPDGACYICNSGGFEWHAGADGSRRPGLQAPDYSGGRIERVDLRSGAVTVLYSQGPHGPLRGPNDIVFDRAGGFWFTDTGKRRPRDMDHGGVYYATIDGKSIQEVVYPMNTANGIGLSPDERTLYVAETSSGRLWAFDIEAPGKLRRGATPNGGRLVAGLPGYQLFDSLAVEAGGNICVATLFNGGITVISPDGASIEHVPLPDAFVTNLCFGGPDMKTAYVTLSSTGRLAALDWPRPGLALLYGA